MKEESDQNTQASSSRKRTRHDSDSKKIKIAKQDDPNQETTQPAEGDIIIIESAETDKEASADSSCETASNTLAKRCLTDEINLTNDMVKWIILQMILK